MSNCAMVIIGDPRARTHAPRTARLELAEDPRAIRRQENASSVEGWGGIGILHLTTSFGGLDARIHAKKAANGSNATR
jgi:hypothetical protein